MTRRARLPLSTLLVLALAWALPLAAESAGTAQNSESAGTSQSGTSHAPPLPTRLTVDLVFGEDAFGRAPSHLAWSPDGRRLAYLYQEGAGGEGSDSGAVWLLDAASGAREQVFDLAHAGEGGAALAADDLLWSPRGDALLLVAGGDLHLLDLSPGAGRSLRRLTKTAAAEEDPKFSPDGGRIAFVRGEDLHLLDLASGKETALTRGGEKNVTLNGTTDWVYWEEIWDRDATGYWWSPDGKQIAYYQFDERPVKGHPLVDYAPAQFAGDPAVAWQKYPRAGEPNPRVRVGVLNLASGRTTWMATAPAQEAKAARDDYLARVDWSPDGKSLAVQRLNREQTRLDLLSCRPGDGACTPRHTEEHATWVNLGRDFHMLPDGRFLWATEAGGWRRLWLHGAGGEPLRPLTPESWAITSLDGVTADGRVIATGFDTAGLGAARRQVLAVRLADGAVEPLAAEPGWNTALVAPATGNWVHTWSDGDHLPRLEVRRADGTAGAPLPTGPPAFDPEPLPRWEMLTIPGPGGAALPARLLKPAGFDPSRRYPAIVFHYGGPGSQVVSDSWDTRSAWHKMMAQQGFAVLMVDNLSSSFFGKAGEDRDYRRFGEGDLAAQLAAVDYLRGLGWVDTSRLGLWGWSGGGAATLYCLLNRPGVWRAGVAGAPVTDWSLYDSIWTERYLDRPQDDPEGYRLSSPATYADNLKDRLLIVHGTADDNVHPQNTLALVARWVEAGIPFEEAIYPRQKHGFKRVANRHFYARMSEFFTRTLAAERAAETNLSAPRP